MRKGDVVRVLSGSGAVTIGFAARAEKDARRGEAVRVAPLRGGAAFEAVVTGPGEARIGQREGGS